MNDLDAAKERESRETVGWMVMIFQMVGEDHWHHR